MFSLFFFFLLAEFLYSQSIKLLSVRVKRAKETPQHNTCCYFLFKGDFSSFFFVQNPAGYDFQSLFFFARNKRHDLQ